MRATAGYRILRPDGCRVAALPWLPEEWLREALAASGEIVRKGVLHLPLPPGLPETEGVVKIYRRRPKHGLWRRLRRTRAAKEGAGYLEFARRGIATPKLLAFGERRRWGLWDLGLIATAHVDAGTVADAYPRPEGPALVRATAGVLGEIHAKGLAHGDALIRNFFATEPDPLPFDLASWGMLTREREADDLQRFLGSLLRLGAADEELEAVLGCVGRELPLPAEALFANARAFAERTHRSAARKERPESP